MRPWLLAIAITACSGTPEPSPAEAEPSPDPAPEAPATDEEATDEEATDEEATDEGAALAMGWSEMPEEGSSSARANRDALRLHGQGDYTASRAAFQAIVDEHPSRDIVRYNLACAMSRAGDQAAAAREMETLLARDLPTYLPRLRSDADLEGLRGSPQMPSLQARAGSLEALYREAAGRGTVMYTRASGVLRAGVWLPEERRFVPLGPRVPGAHSVLVDADLDAVIVETSRPGSVEDCETESCATRRLQRFSLTGRGPSVEHAIEWAADLAFHALAEGGIRFRAEPAESMSAPVWGQRWLEIDPGDEDEEPSPSRESPDRPFIMSRTWHEPRYSRHSYRERQFGNGFIVRGNQLLTPESAQPIPLTAGHLVMSGRQWIAVAPDRSTALVISSSCQRHLIDRVDLRERRLDEPIRGRGWATARVDGDRVFIQFGDVVREIPSLAADLQTGGSALPAGVSLANVLPCSE